MGKGVHWVQDTADVIRLAGLDAADGVSSIDPRPANRGETQAPDLLQWL